MATQGQELWGEKQSESILLAFPSSRSGENSDPSREDMWNSFWRHWGLRDYTELQPLPGIEGPRQS